MMKKLLPMMIPAFLALGLPGWAADPEPTVEPMFGRHQFELSFKGGSPRQLVEALTVASGSKPNVLVPPELADVQIPAFELRSVDVRGVFDSLNLLWRNSMMWVRSSSGGGGSPNAGVWVLSRGQDSRQAKAFYVGHLLRKFKIDDVTTAVRSTWELGGRASTAELKYHQDTQLLLALGAVDQLNSMSEVLAQLRLALEPETVDAKTAPDAKAKSPAKP